MSDDYCTECNRSNDTEDIDNVDRVLSQLGLEWAEVFAAGRTINAAHSQSAKFRTAADLSAGGGGNWYQLVHRLREAADLVDFLCAMLVVERRLSDRMSDALRDEYHNRGDAYTAPMVMAIHTMTRQQDQPPVIPWNHVPGFGVL